MMRCPTFFLAVASWVLCFPGVASAADIRRNDHPLYPFILEGTIVPGDYDRLRELIDEDCTGKYHNSAGYCHSSIYLASPRLVRTLRWETQIPEEYPPGTPDLRSGIVAATKLKDPKENYMCASACFFVYVAGIERNFFHWKPILGVHRPHFSDTDLRTLSANQAMASGTQVRTIVETYLKEMGVPAKYADLMFSVPKDQVRWIDEADLKSDFTGVIPELQDWLDARCDKRTDVEKRVEDALEAKFMRGELTADEQEMRSALLQKFQKPQVDCEERWKDKLREDAWNAFKR
ncbi:MAG: hypothetical protein ACLQFW_23565 [Xanthobacteraceae bacterium]